MSTIERREYTILSISKDAFQALLMDIVKNRVVLLALYYDGQGGGSSAVIVPDTTSEEALVAVLASNYITTYNVRATNQLVGVNFQSTNVLSTMYTELNAAGYKIAQYMGVGGSQFYTTDPFPGSAEVITQAASGLSQPRQQSLFSM